jgi:hypothetical protein
LALKDFGRRLAGVGAVAAPPHVFTLDEGRLSYARLVPGPGGGHELRELRGVDLPADTFVPGVLGGAPREAAVFAERLGALLQGLSTPVQQASLVLPDAWLRVTFVETGDLPKAQPAREEVVRWKVKRLVPFRVEDLRLSWVEVAPLPQQTEPRRLLVAYALEVVLAALEDAFAARGIWLGRITSESLAVLPAVERALAPAALGALAVVHGTGYTLLFARHGEPVLHRFKGVDGPGGDGSVPRDLRLTRAFVGEQLGEVPVDSVILVAPADRAAAWSRWLEEGLGRAAEPIETLQLPLVATDRVAWADVAPMLGAVRQEVT